MRSLLFLFTCFISFAVYGQSEMEVNIETMPDSLKTGDVLNLKVTVRNTSQANISDFPEIEGLRKESKSVSHANVEIEGKTVLQHIVIQNYRAINWGTFDFPEFTFDINGTEHSLPSGQIIITNSEDPDEEQFLAAENEDALLFLFVNKRDIYIGEGFRIHLAFYVSDENTASWEFPKNLSYQVNLLADRLKPENSLESRRNIVNVPSTPATINGKKYIQYRLYEGVYYPLTVGSITLPAVSLNIDKVLINEDSTANNEDSTANIEIRAFRSQQFTVNVLPLPEHPLKDRVSVGDFKLIEQTTIAEAQTGKILNFALKIRGEGNAETILMEKPENDENFDFYPPQIFERQNDGAEIGEKTFTFKVFPKDSGVYNMGNYFQWIYFNTRLKTYDTLRVNQKWAVTGERVETSSSQTGGLYEGIASLSISEKSINYRKIVKNTAKVLLFLMLGGMVFIFDFKRRKEQ